MDSAPGKEKAIRKRQDGYTMRRTGVKPFLAAVEGKTGWQGSWPRPRLPPLSEATRQPEIGLLPPPVMSASFLNANASKTYGAREHWCAGGSSGSEAWAVGSVGGRSWHH